MLRAFARRDIIASVLLIFICLLVFSNTFANPFMWDDNDFIAGNRYIKSLKYIPYFFTPGYWKILYSGEREGLREGRADYRPLSMALFAFDYSFWGLNPSGYHVTNLMLHIINVLLIYLLLKMLEPAGPDGSGWPAAAGLPFLASLLFAVYPIHTESVTWIKNRSDLSALLFSLLSFIFFISFSRNKQKPLYYFASVLLFLAAILSKAMAVVLPFILAAYVLYFIPRQRHIDYLFKTIPFFVVSSAYLLFKKFTLGGLISFEPASRLEGLIHLMTVFKTIGYYLWLFIFPVNLNVERGFILPQNLFEFPVVFSIISIAAVISVIIWSFRLNRLLSFMLCWMLFTLIPVSNIIFLYERPIAEARLYIPSLGFCTALAIIIKGLPSIRSGLVKKGTLKNISAISLLCILITYSSATIRRNFDWRGPIVFWEKASLSSPQNPRVCNNLGMAYAEAGLYHEAIRSYRKAIELNENYAQPYNNLGKAYSSLGMDHEAVSLYKKAMETDPDYEMAYYNLATAYYNLGKREDAIVLYKKAIDLNPYYVKAHLNLGAVYNDMGRYKDAIDSYKRALAIDSYYAAAYNNLAIAYMQKGAYELAVESYNKAKALGIDNPMLSEGLKPYME